MVFKRCFDIIASFFGLIVLSPLFILIIFWIKTTSKGTVFFRQTRIGLNEQPFQIHKFRTMVIDGETKGLKITVDGDPRVTKAGYFLRKAKLDELPQLIDVLLGKMSLVGPRPEVPEYIKYYPSKVKAIVLSVRPGITDWASIKMIDESLILAKTANPEQVYIQQILPQKLKYALKYIKNQSLFLDIYLIFLTIIKIFRR